MARSNRCRGSSSSNHTSMTTTTTTTRTAAAAAVPTAPADVSVVGSCNYHVIGSNHCSHPDLHLRMCNHSMCHVSIHHLCQLQWEEANRYEETTTSRCQLHHPRVLNVLSPIPNTQVPVATMPTLPPLTIRNQQYNISDDTPPPDS